MLKYLKLARPFNSAGIREEMNQWSDPVWSAHYQKLYYEGDWTVIALRSVQGKTDDIIVSPHEDAVYADTPLLQQSPKIQEALSFFKCPLLAVRLMKLNAGSLIKEHRDADLSFENGEVRLHIPVITHPDVDFLLDGEPVPMRENECWYVNVNLPHALHNRSNTDRIHLVIDAKVNDFILDLFSGDGVSLRKDIPDPRPEFDEATKKHMIRLFREMNTETGNRMADELEGSSGPVS